MTYRYSKKTGWIGYCDQCSHPFNPYVVVVCCKEISLSMFAKTHKPKKGCCRTCADNNKWVVDIERTTVCDSEQTYRYICIDGVYVV
jgi:hypothetical protein